ncbi:glycosyltransferase family protein [Methanohalophilus halophilus]|uniref:Glycosyltransferase RgtA/B/C/D-like domain-containing protein n=1 Tax=Methanohalophilus halophilus TaxID=2177 RepID=A0A1L3Q119_9EURY|nr:hypothetical protein [Methanohalophilus halophilus]APH38559.1 hypothetical protein BHR79_03005 [Methanohalophilus halophilus]RNI08446.1 hypothetical protein EFE40_07865 [Methanohalophilus halophilus]SDW14369.1 hypothetical protein SAMN04515625_0432 [Methanohalophilus halophilus]
MFKPQFEKSIDYILAIVGFILGILIISLYTMSPTIHLVTIGMALTLGCALYIILKKRLLITNNVQKSSINEKRILDIAYLLFFSLSLIIWNTSVDRPFSYFLIFSLCAGALALSIYLSDNKLDYYIQYGKIILLSFNIKYSIYMLAGYIPGVDTYWHSKMNELLALSGNIASLQEKEFYFPIMHIQTAVMEIVSAAPIKDASNFAIIVPFVIASTFVYLVGRELFGEKIGLFAMLLVNFSDFHIYWGSAPQTTSYGIILYYLLMYVLYKIFSENFNPKWITMSIFLMITLIITHAVSSFIFVVTMFALAMGSLIYNYWYEKDRKILYNGLFLISVVALLQHWFIALYSKGGKPFFDKIVSSLHYYVTGVADFLDRPEVIADIATTLPPFIERFADTLGLSLYLFFAIMGSLLALSYKYRNQINFNYILVMIILFGITFAFPLFGIRNIIPSRWFAFEYFIVSIFAAFAIIQLSHVTNKIILKKVFIVTIFCMMAFFMSASTFSGSNVDSPIWLEDSTISTTYNTAEIQAAETMALFSDNFFSDSRYGSSVLGVYLSDSGSKRNLTTSFNNKEQIHKRKKHIFLWRNYMLNRPIRTHVRIEGYDQIVAKNEVLGHNTLESLYNSQKIYTNNEIIGYYVR